MTLQDLKQHTDAKTAQRIVNVLREHIPSKPSVKGSRINNDYNIIEAKRKLSELCRDVTASDKNNEAYRKYYDVVAEMVDGGVV